MDAAWTRMGFATEVMTSVVNHVGFKERFGTLASQPYNRDKPDQTIWWLFPKSATPWGSWPAYSAGKFYIFAGKHFLGRPDDRRVMRVGLHVEKGISERNAVQGYGTAKGKHFGMTATWAWHRFLPVLENGELEKAIDEIARRSGMPVEVSLEPSFPMDAPELMGKFAFHRFEAGAGGTLRLIEEGGPKDKVVGVGAVTTLKALGERLRQATAEEEWTWINLYVCVAVPCLSEPPPGSGPAWTGSDFWQRVLEPLAPWVG